MRRQNIRALVFPVLAAAVLLGCSGPEPERPAPSPPAEPGNPLIASIGDYELRRDEFRAYVKGYWRDVERDALKRPLTVIEKFEFMNSALDSMALRVFMAKDATARGLWVSDDELEIQVEGRMAEVLGPAEDDSEKTRRRRLAEFESHLQESFGVDLDAFRKWLLQDMARNRTAPLLAAELRERNREQVLARARSALARLEAGEPVDAMGGVDMGWMAVLELREELRAAVAGMSPGRISEPIVAPDAVHLAWLRARDPAADRVRVYLISFNLAGVEEAIMGWLEERKQSGNFELIDPYVRAYEYHTHGDTAARRHKPKGEFDHETAVELWREAEKSEPPIDELHRAYASYFQSRAYYYWAVAHNARGLAADAFLEAAVRAGERARVLAQTEGFSDPEFELALGETLMRLGRRDQALEMLDLASELAGEGSQVRVRLRWLFEDLDADERAARETELIESGR